MERNDEPDRDRLPESLDPPGIAQARARFREELERRAGERARERLSGERKSREKPLPNIRRGGTIHFPVVKPDGTVRVIPITVSEFAQRRWPDIPDRLRWYFTFLGAVTPSKLLPAETRALLYSALQLRLAGRPAVEWARDLEGIRAARRLVTELREVEAYATGKPAGRVSAPVPEFEVVEDHLIKLEKVVRDAEQQVKAAGYEWKDGLVRKGKGRPSRADDLLGQLVRVLVHIWIDQGGEPGNHPETRVWIASQLAPFYPAATPDTSSRPSPLYTAVGNAFRR